MYHRPSLQGLPARWSTRSLYPSYLFLTKIKLKSLGKLVLTGFDVHLIGLYTTVTWSSGHISAYANSRPNYNNNAMGWPMHASLLLMTLSSSPDYLACILNHTVCCIQSQNLLSLTLLFFLLNKQHSYQHTVNLRASESASFYLLNSAFCTIQWVLGTLTVQYIFVVLGSIKTCLLHRKAEMIEWL